MATSLVTGQTFECQVIDDFCVFGTYPDPQSCAHYYYCTPTDEGTRCIQLRQQCPPGYAFHKDFLQCTLAQHAVCDGKS